VSLPHERSPGRREETCDDCGTETPHDVAIELRSDASGAGDRAKFAREPYRVTTCRECGREHARRMNDSIGG
jgi:ribosomal protein S14